MNLPKLNARPAPAPVPGTWKLPAGHAMTLSPREPGLLEVVYGEVWATFDGPHAGPLNDWGDRVVRAGDRLWLHAGQHLVVESWRKDAPAFFNWEPRAPDTDARRTVAAPAACTAS